MKKLFVVLAALLTLCLCAGSALAEVIQFEGETPTLVATDAEGNVLAPVQQASIIVLGRTDDNKVLVRAGDAMVYVDYATLQAAFDGAPLPEIPTLSELEPLQRGADRDAIVALQQALIDMGYLEGSADGSYGNMTSTAVAAVQTAYQLEATGVADAVTRQLIMALGTDPIVVNLLGDPTELFAAIADRTESDLTPLYTDNIRFAFDDISGIGFISNGNSVAYASPEGTADIDQYAFELNFGFSVTDKSGTVTVRPGINVTSTSVRRPMVQSILLKSGDERVTLKTASTESSLSGSKSVELDKYNANAAAAALLANAATNGELKVRIVGKYQSFDITATAEEIAGVAEIGAIMQQFLGE